MDVYLFPFDKVARGSKIIIYGASIIGKAYMEQLLRLDYCECLFVVDRDYETIKWDFDVPLYSPTKVFDSEYDVIVVAALPFAKEISNFLVNNGITKEKIIVSAVMIEPKLQAEQFYADYRKYPIEESTILYESYSGAGLICTPYELFRELLCNPSYSEYKHVWSIADEAEIEKLNAEYHDFSNISFVRYMEDEYAYYCATAKYIVTNAFFPSFLAKRKGQIFLNTWHDIASKSQEFEMPNGNRLERFALRSLLQCDYIVAANEKIKETLLDTYRLNGIYTGTIIMEGHSGDSNRRIADIVFNKAANYNLYTCDNKKIKLLFNAGALLNGGQTEVFLAFLGRLDYEKFDVSVLYFNKSYPANVNRIPKQARIFAHYYDKADSPGEQARMRSLTQDSYCEYIDSPVIKYLFEKEFTRCFGGAEFDYVIDFNGYGLFGPVLLSFAENAKKYIWQHADVYQTFSNNDERILRNNSSFAASCLKNLPHVYERYDKVISVCQPLMEVNRAKMANEKTYNKFDYVDNPISIERIKNCLEQGDAPKVQDSHKDVIKFVTVGRLMPQKNHANLIKGFAKFLNEYPKSALYVVGGGLLEVELNELVSKLNLQDNVVLTGHTSNPFVLMSGCDCFILPSHYEGQSLVVNEARYFGLPIILSDYSSVEGACVPNGQLIIGHGEDDIYSGMLAFAKGGVPSNYEFDAEKYNAECFVRFEALFSEGD